MVAKLPSFLLLAVLASIASIGIFGSLIRASALNEAMMAAAQSGDLPKIQHLRKLGASLNDGTEGGCFTPLEAAINSDKPETAQWLVDHGAVLGDANQCDRRVYSSKWLKMVEQATLNRQMVQRRP